MVIIAYTCIEHAYGHDYILIYCIHIYSIYNHNCINIFSIYSNNCMYILNTPIYIYIIVHIDIEYITKQQQPLVFKF